MDKKFFESIPPELRREIIQQQLIVPTKVALYRLEIQRRAAEITDDKTMLEAVGADAKRLAAQFAVYEKIMAEIALDEKSHPSSMT